MFDPQIARLQLACCRPPNRREPNMKAARRTIAFFQVAEIILDNDPTAKELIEIFTRHLAWAREWMRRLPHDDRLAWSAQAVEQLLRRWGKPVSYPTRH